MKLISDLHIHSKYSRATSKDMNIPELVHWAKLKGIGLLGTGDFTHPGWLQELKKYLTPVSEYTFGYNEIKFILTTEINNIFYRKGRCYRVHNIIFLPDFKSVEKFNTKLSGYGELVSDGRPIVSIDCIDLLDLVNSVTENSLVVPAHAWTPHFSVFGSQSGFDSLEECFEKNVRYISGIETGLSSDPRMNWRLSKLDNITLISNSDAHSPQNLGREANVFDIVDNADLYTQITQIIKTKDRKKFLYTIEFYPEEGKYHYDGHRNCNLRLHPKETLKYKNLCPVCGKKVTIGVLNRVEKLADREENQPVKNVIPYKNVIPLMEIIADALEVAKGTQKVDKEYLWITSQVGPEFQVLLDIEEEELKSKLNHKIVDGIVKMRNGKVDILPGYDGEYGQINIRWNNVGQETKEVMKEKQLELFS